MRERFGLVCVAEFAVEEAVVVVGEDGCFLF